MMQYPARGPPSTRRFHRQGHFCPARPPPDAPKGVVPSPRAKVPREPNHSSLPPSRQARWPVQMSRGGLVRWLRTVALGTRGRDGHGVLVLLVRDDGTRQRRRDQPSQHDESDPGAEHCVHAASQGSGCVSGYSPVWAHLWPDSGVGESVTGVLADASTNLSPSVCRWWYCLGSRRSRCSPRSSGSRSLGRLSSLPF